MCASSWLPKKLSTQFTTTIFLPSACFFFFPMDLVCVACEWHTDIGGEATTTTTVGETTIAATPSHVSGNLWMKLLLSLNRDLGAPSWSCCCCCCCCFGLSAGVWLRFLWGGGVYRLMSFQGIVFSRSGGERQEFTIRKMSEDESK